MTSEPRPASFMLFAVLCTATASVTGACGKGSANPSTTTNTAVDGGAGGLGSGGAAPLLGGTAISGGMAQENAGSGPGEGGSADGAQPTVLGGACPRPGALACAGSHQKLTLVCSAQNVWEVNQTCSAHEFCDSTSGPNLGICAVPPPECLDQKPGTLVCSGDSLVKCGPDSVTIEFVEQCAHGCTDGACSQVGECPALLFSCDPVCQDSASGCYDLCAGVAVAAEPPLLALADATVGEEHRLALPVFSEASACACAEVGPALAEVAFRLPEPPAGLQWKIETSPPWEIGVNNYEFFAGTQYGNGCVNHPLARSCHVWPSEAIVWVGTRKVSPEPAHVIVTLGVTATTHCE